MSKQVSKFGFSFGSWTNLKIRSQTIKGSRLMGDLPKTQQPIKLKNSLFTRSKGTKDYNVAVSLFHLIFS